MITRQLGNFFGSARFEMVFHRRYGAAAERVQRSNFLYLIRDGMTESSPNLRFLSSS
jgi:hypothetical protein